MYLSIKRIVMYRPLTRHTGLNMNEYLPADYSHDSTGAMM